MIRTFNSMLFFPLARAQQYSPSTGTGDRDDHVITDLDVQFVTVDTSAVTVGLVTISTRSSDPDLEGYGEEYDLTPSAARALGLQLLAAAIACEAESRARGGGADGDDQLPY